MKRRSPKSSGKINGGQGIVLEASSMVFPDYRNEVQITYLDRPAKVTIHHEYDKRSGYWVHVHVSLGDQELNEYDYQAGVLGGNSDGWAEYCYTLFSGTFMQNQYELVLPRPFVKLVEQRLDYLASQEVA